MLFRSKAVITGKPGRAMAPNYAQLTQDSILADAADIQVGDSLYIQTFLADIYAKVVSVSMVEIKTFSTPDKSYIPAEQEYIYGNIYVTNRQKAVFDASRIEVTLRD